MSSDLTIQLFLNCFEVVFANCNVSMIKKKSAIKMASPVNQSPNPAMQSDVFKPDLAC